MAGKDVAVDVLSEFKWECLEGEGFNLRVNEIRRRTLSQSALGHICHHHRRILHGGDKSAIETHTLHS